MADNGLDLRGRPAPRSTVPTFQFESGVRRGVRVIVAMVFAHVWGSVQLVLLGSFARTVRVRTVLVAIAAGFYACAILAILLEWSWIYLAAWLIGQPTAGVIPTASYTIDPFI